MASAAQAKALQLASLPRRFDLGNASELVSLRSKLPNFPVYFLNCKLSLYETFLDLKCQYPNHVGEYTHTTHTHIVDPLKPIHSSVLPPKATTFQPHSHGLNLGIQLGEDLPSPASECVLPLPRP